MVMLQLPVERPPWEYPLEGRMRSVNVTLLIQVIR